MIRHGSARVAWLIAIAVVLTSLAIGESASVAAEKARVIVRGPTTHKTIALTIDDGYDAKRCHEIYNTLVRFRIPATWFPNAVHVRTSKEIWQRIGARFEIANHTTHHSSLPSLSSRAMRKEISTDEQIVEAVTGQEMVKILRPPYGAYDDRVLREAGRLGYDVIALWDVTSADTAKDPPDRKIAQNMLRGHAGSIVLLHCGPPVTPRVLPIVIARYACQGFKFASLTDLLAGQQGTEAKVTCPPPRLPPPEKRKSRPPLADELLANDWRLVEAVTGDALGPVAPDEAFTLGFVGRTASGTIGCETFSARLRMKQDGSVKFRRPARDDSACEVPVLPEAAAHLDLLLSTVGYRLNDGSLVFVDAAGQARLRFDPFSAGALIGGWTVSAIDDGTGLLATATAPPTVTFTATGELSGSTGCDTYSSTYSTLDDTITVGEVVVGTAVCDATVADQAQRFLTALGAIATWQVEGPALQLLDPEQRAVLTLGATTAPVPSPAAQPSPSALP